MESNITIDIDNDSFGISSEDTIDSRGTTNSSLKITKKGFSSNISLSEIKKCNCKKEAESEKMFYSGKKKQKTDKSEHLILFGKTNKILNPNSREKVKNECLNLSKSNLTLSNIEINSNLCSYALIQDFKENMYFNRSKNGALYVAKFTNVESIIDKNVFEKGIKNPYRFQNLNTETKHWNQRYYYYSKYDEGIKMDTESWYSVTPEDLSFYISKIAGKNSVCIDPFAGSGGNVIQFSKNCQKVYAVDIDPNKIDLCVNNSKVYKCPDNIEFILKDALELEGLKTDFVFLSPPWGGTNYKFSKNYSLKKMVTPDIHEIVKKCLTIGKNLMFYLPRTIDIYELFEIIQSCNNEKAIYLNVHILKSANKIKAILLMFGPSTIDLKVNDLMDILDFIFSKIKSQAKKSTANKKDIIFIKRKDSKDDYGHNQQEEYTIESKVLDDSKNFKDEYTLESFIFRIYSLLGLKKFIESLEKYKNRLEKNKNDSKSNSSFDCSLSLIDNDLFIKDLIQFFINEVLTEKQLTRLKNR